MNARRQILPHAERLQHFETLVTFGILLAVIFCLSVYVISLPVKAMLVLALACVFFNRNKTLSRSVWPLLAIPLYGAAVSFSFPCWHPDLWTILERPLFTVLCVLMVSVAFSQSGDWRYRMLAFGILIVSLIGAIGDSMGYDMTSMLPFTMPDENYFDQVTLAKSGGARVRGFFPESGVLGAVSLGIATCTGLGAWVAISQRRRPAAVATLLAASLIGIIMLGITFTKSGLFMVAAGMSGFIVLLALGRNRACRATALFGAIAMAALLAGLVLVPGDLGAYFRSELGTALNLQAQTGQSGGSGLATRVECWKLAFYSVEYYPLGVGGWGVDNVMNRTTAIVPTPEMRFFFDRDMFGLKSALANLVAQTGLVGIGLLGLWLWWSFLGPAFHLLRSGKRVATLLAGLYGASAGLSLVFLFTCELYPSYALLLFFKLHADAVAASVQEPLRQIAEEPIEGLQLPAEASA
jgi:hypothetical protein